MRIAILGSIYGNIEQTYLELGKMVYQTSVPINWVLSTGNFGVWPDPLRADKASKSHPGDFLDYLVGKKSIPIPTLMVAGKHEDSLWISKMLARGDGELVNNLHFLVSGNHTTIEDQETVLRVVGLGGTYSPNPKRGNYSMKDVANAALAGPVDIFLSHEAPDGQKFGILTSQAKGINKVCFATQPRLLLHGKYPETVLYQTKQTNTKAICVGNKEILVIDMTKDFIKVI